MTRVTVEANTAIITVATDVLMADPDAIAAAVAAAAGAEVEVVFPTTRSLRLHELP